MKTAIVFMTDGIPQGCEDTDERIDTAAAEVAKVKDVAPTYVIGVGPNLSNLNKIAHAGGTGEAFLIDDTNEPGTVQQKFQAAIDTIRGRTLSCELALPPPPPGETLDLQKVNVTYTTGAGARQPLAYDEACAANGWKFDAPANPTKIMLCEKACTPFKADPNGVVNVEFGCDRRSVVK